MNLLLNRPQIKKRCSGQAMIELAIMTPLLIAIGLAAIEFSFVVILNQRVSQLSREAANAAIRDCVDARYTLQPLGDINGDGVVDDTDEAAYAALGGRDVNGDGTVNSNDLNTLRAYKGISNGDFGSSSKPMQTCLQEITDDISNRIPDLLKKFATPPDLSTDPTDHNFHAQDGWLAMTAFAVDPRIEPTYQTARVVGQAVTRDLDPAAVSRAEAIIKTFSYRSAPQMIQDKKAPLFVTEVKYKFSTLTPVGQMLHIAMPETLYESTVA